MQEHHQKLADFIWSIANKLRGPYRPPQYRKVMLPLIVLRRLDCVLEPTKDQALKQYKELKKKGLSEAAVQKTLAKIASKDRVQPLYNISPYTFQKLLGEAAVENETLRTAANVNTLDNFKHVFDRMLEGLFIDRRDGNEEIFDRIINDPQFRDLASAHLVREVYERLRAAKAEDAA